MNLTTFRARITGALGLDNTASSTEQGLVDGWVNEGRDQLMVRAKLRVERTSAALTANTVAYELDASILQPIRVVLNGTSGHPLEPWSVDRINWANQNTVSPVRGYTILGTNYLMLAGAPSTGDSLDIIYIPAVTDMSSGSHDPSSATYGGIPKLLHPTIEVYAKWKAADWDNNVSSQQGLVYKAGWEQGLKEARAFRTKMRGPVAPARVRRRSYSGYAPGVDTGQGWQ